MLHTDPLKLTRHQCAVREGFSDVKMLLLRHLVTLTCAPFHHQSESFIQKPPTPCPLNHHFSLLSLSLRLRCPAADSPAMSLFVLVMNSKLPLSSESLGD